MDLPKDAHEFRFEQASTVRVDLNSTTKPPSQSQNPSIIRERTGPSLRGRKRRVANEGDSFGFVPWKKCRHISIQDVRESYERARMEGVLKSPFLPREAPISNDNAPAVPWDPYNLSKRALRYALLDKQKLEAMFQQLASAIQRVPVAGQWTIETQTQGLTATHLREILRTAFSTDWPPSTQKLIATTEIPFILKMALVLFHQANLLLSQDTTLRRAAAVVRIVGHALVCLSEVVEKVPTSLVNSCMKQFLNGNNDWQKRSRNFACFWRWVMARLEGWRGLEVSLYLMLTEPDEVTLRTLYTPSLPAAAGEFVSALGVKDYTEDVPDLTGLPGVIEIVKAIVANHASNITICRAFDYPDSHLNGFEDYSYDFLDKFLEAVTPQSSIRPRPDPAWTADQGRTPEQQVSPRDGEHFVMLDQEVSGAPLEDELIVGPGGCQLEKDSLAQGGQLEDVELNHLSNFDLDQYLNPYFDLGQIPIFDLEQD